MSKAKIVATNFERCAGHIANFRAATESFVADRHKSA
jgi:hypothetical protein